MNSFRQGLLRTEKDALRIISAKPASSVLASSKNLKQSERLLQHNADLRTVMLIPSEIEDFESTIREAGFEPEDFNPVAVEDDILGAGVEAIKGTVTNFAAQHRYLIISANARCIDEFSQHPEWGLCLWESGRIFKVIDVQENAEHTQTTLLEVPEHLLDQFVSPFLSDIERQFAVHAAEQFNLALGMQPLPEHQTRLWLDRLVLPVGVDDSGRFFKCWQPVS